MIRLKDFALPPDSDFSDLPALCARLCGIPREQVLAARLLRRSVDARRKDQIRFICSFAAEVKNEDKVLAGLKNHAEPYAPVSYMPPKRTAYTGPRPVIVGFGPAGMFAALVLAEAGLCPLVLERGRAVEDRRRAVETFWRGGRLDPESNVQFGEGGAGTFSDGKLNTGIRDPRCGWILQRMIEFGAPESIGFDAKPHVGTDRLAQVVHALRERVIALGGEVRFGSRFCDFSAPDGILREITAEQAGKQESIPCRTLILAPGHSARDTFTLLYSKNVAIMQKPFAVGVRIEHRQDWLNRVQYGRFAEHPALGAADYKLQVHPAGLRGVYTFCMCPGGSVVAAASETGGVCTNGMSLYRRDGENCNSALLVGVEPADFGSDHPLAGVEFQRKIEQAAFRAAGGTYAAPACTVEDFLSRRSPSGQWKVIPSYCPKVTPCLPDGYLPAFVCESLRASLPLFDRKLPGFADGQAVLCGPESRSSSPVRILRNDRGEAQIRGIYPCGEGAGYAGGILSAAADGVRAAEEVCEKTGILEKAGL